MDSRPVLWVLSASHGLVAAEAVVVAVSPFSLFLAVHWIQSRLPPPTSDSPATAPSAVSAALFAHYSTPTTPPPSFAPAKKQNVSPTADLYLFPSRSMTDSPPSTPGTSSEVPRQDGDHRRTSDSMMRALLSAVRVKTQYFPGCGSRRYEQVLRRHSCQMPGLPLSQRQARVHSPHSTVSMTRFAVPLYRYYSVVACVASARAFSSPVMASARIHSVVVAREMLYSDPTMMIRPSSSAHHQTSGDIVPAKGA